MDSAYTKRLATLTDADVETITLHRHAMFDEMGVTQPHSLETDHPFRDWLRPRLQSGEYIGVFIEREGVIVAGGGLWLQDWLPGPSAPSGIRGYLCNVYTDPTHRGKGLARAIVNWSLDICREKGFPAMWLHASQFGQPIYESMDFVPTNEMRYVYAEH